MNSSHHRNRTRANHAENTMQHDCHTHAYAHSHAPNTFGRAFAVGISLNAAFVVVEIAFGLRANSLALISDAMHNLGDVMGLLVAWGASRLATWQPTDRHTYGLRKTTILAALFNGLFLLVSVGAILWEAVRRFGAPAQVQTNTIIAVATVGIVINGITALMFMRGREADLNIRGTFLHMLADAGISAGVVVAALLINVTGAKWIDPAVSIAIGIVILGGTWGLLKESMNMFMDAVPDKVDIVAVEHYLRELPGVQELHHMHIWGISTSEIALTAHLVISQPDLANGMLHTVQKELHDHFHIDHATLQFELHEKDVCLTKRCSLHCTAQTGSEQHH